MLLLYDYRIADNILLLLLIQGQGHRLRNKCDAADDASVHTSVNILRQSFELSFLLFLIFLKAYPLCYLRMISAISV